MKSGKTRKYNRSMRKFWKRQNARWDRILLASLERDTSFLKSLESSKKADEGGMRITFKRIS